MNSFSNNSDDNNKPSSALMKELAGSPVDAVIQITIKENKLAAYINIIPPVNGGQKPSLELIKDALEQHDIVFGINMAKIEELAQNPIYNRNILIAQGTIPINGMNGRYSFHFNTEKNLKPKERADGSVDFNDLSVVETVKKGQILCSIKHPTNGIDGMSVKGEKILPVKGKPVPSFAGKNTQLNEEGTAIYSLIDGNVEYNGVKINVSETFYIQENIDNSTGNIKVEGNVVVRGMVLPGFCIEAGGNIEINGTVESATIKAGGNIILRSGIIGSELACQGDLTSRFIENCRVVVKGAIKSEYIMGSYIKCGKSLNIVGAIAKIVGGSCISGQDITARTIGSVANVETNLQLVIDDCIIENQQEVLKQFNEIEEKIQSLKSAIAMLQRLESINRITPEKKKVLDNALNSYDSCMKLLEEKKRELDEINHFIETKGYGRIICTDTIYPATRITIGNEKMHVTDALINVSLNFNNGVISKGSIF